MALAALSNVEAERTKVERDVAQVGKTDTDEGVTDVARWGRWRRMRRKWMRLRWVRRREMRLRWVNRDG